MKKQPRASIRKGLLHGHRVGAVIDTCVIIEATNPRDVYEEYEKLAGQPILPGSDTPDGPMRRKRAKDGLLLIEYLQRRGICTYFLGAEFMRQMAALVPPSNREFPTQFARVFAHHAQALLFPNWKTVTDSGDAGKVGNDCDRHLVQIASWLGVPLITSETKPKGAIRKAAAKAGVRVMSPWQFWSLRASERALAQALLRRWGARKQKLWRRARPMFVSDAVAADVLGYMGGYLRHVLLGETAAASGNSSPPATTASAAPAT